MCFCLCFMCFLLLKHPVCKGLNGDFFFLPVIQYFCPNWTRPASQTNKSLFTQLVLNALWVFFFPDTKRWSLMKYRRSMHRASSSESSRRAKRDQMNPVKFGNKCYPHDPAHPFGQSQEITNNSINNSSVCWRRVKALTAPHCAETKPLCCSALLKNKGYLLLLLNCIWPNLRETCACLFRVLICTVWGPLSALLLFSPPLWWQPCQKNISSRLKHFVPHCWNLENYCGKVLDKHLKDGNTFQCGFLIPTFFFFFVYVLCWFDLFWVFFFFTSANPLSFMKSLTFLMPPTLSD